MHWFVLFDQGMERFTIHNPDTHPRHLNHLLKAIRIRPLRLQGTRIPHPHNMEVVIKDTSIKGILRRRLPPRFTIVIIIIKMMTLVVPPFYEDGMLNFPFPPLFDASPWCLFFASYLYVNQFPTQGWGFYDGFKCQNRGQYAILCSVFYNSSVMQYNGKQITAGNV